jgi:hypothetical protein
MPHPTVFTSHSIELVNLLPSVGKRDFAGVIYLRTWKWVDYNPGLPELDK